MAIMMENVLVDIQEELCSRLMETSDFKLDHDIEWTRFIGQFLKEKKPIKELYDMCFDTTLLKKNTIVRACFSSLYLLGVSIIFVNVILWFLTWSFFWLDPLFYLEDSRSRFLLNFDFKLKSSSCFSNILSYKPFFFFSRIL